MGYPCAWFSSDQIFSEWFPPPFSDRPHWPVCQSQILQVPKPNSSPPTPAEIVLVMNVSQLFLKFLALSQVNDEFYTIEPTEIYFFCM